MLSLGEYRNKADRLADLLPWAALIAPGIVLNKDGSFQRTFRYQSPDLESATEAELVGLCARANNALKRLGSGWALFFDAERLEAQHYPSSEFPDAASWLVDEERRAAFEGEPDQESLQWSDSPANAQGQHFESRYHLTLLYMPPPDAQARTENALLERDRKGGEERSAARRLGTSGGRFEATNARSASEGLAGIRNWRQELARFGQETERVLDLLSGFLPEVRALDDTQTLTFLHGTVSTKRHPVNVPETPMYLDGVLVDTSLTGGLEPMLGEKHLRTLTILGFPNTTRPGILDALDGYQLLAGGPLCETLYSDARNRWLHQGARATRTLRKQAHTESLPTLKHGRHHAREYRLDVFGLSGNTR